MYMDTWEHPRWQGSDYNGGFQEISKCWKSGEDYNQPHTQVIIARGYWWTTCYDGVTPEQEEDYEEMIIVKRTLDNGFMRKKVKFDKHKNG